ncbi:MAG: methylglyoxal synthase [Candidatus Odinarchaeota archaeon]
MNKPIIALLADGQDWEANYTLIRILCLATKHFPEIQGIKMGEESVFSRFHLFFTGGTHRRIFKNLYRVNGKWPDQRSDGNWPRRPEYVLDDEVDRWYERFAELIKDHLEKNYTIVKLPESRRGGVAFLTSLIINRKISIIVPLLSPFSRQWHTPTTQALLRLCDRYRVKKLHTIQSVLEWLEYQAEEDSRPNKIEINSNFRVFAGDKDNYLKLIKKEGEKYYSFYHYNEKREELGKELGFYSIREKWNDIRVDMFDKTIALISHDKMKPKMEDFVFDNYHKLGIFKRIITTRTTGETVKKIAPDIEKKVVQYHSGPEGGDIEIATEIWAGMCDIVIFFVDPQSAHPHTADIQTVIGAACTSNSVLLLSNEKQARDWIANINVYKNGFQD